MPADNTDLRRSLEHWLEVHGVRPVIVGEFEDSALAAVFSEAAVGAFVSPTSTEAQVKRQYGLSVLGRAKDITASYYAISLDRRLKHPAVVAISEFAHRSVFQGAKAYNRCNYRAHRGNCSAHYQHGLG
jgi:LysR family transcriptional regulator, transcriptional activator of nhaA